MVNKPAIEWKNLSTGCLVAITQGLVFAVRSIGPLPASGGCEYLIGQLHSIRLPLDQWRQRRPRSPWHSRRCICTRSTHSSSKTRTTPAESSTLQSLEQRAELGYRRMQRSVAMLFFVGAYVSHPSVLDTFGTFININPFKSELFM